MKNLYSEDHKTLLKKELSTLKLRWKNYHIQKKKSQRNGNYEWKMKVTHGGCILLLVEGE